MEETVVACNLDENTQNHTYCEGREERTAYIVHSSSQDNDKSMLQLLLITQTVNVDGQEVGWL